jgi:hypothetical protein
MTRPSGVRPGQAIDDGRAGRPILYDVADFRRVGNVLVQFAVQHRAE